MRFDWNMSMGVYCSEWNYVTANRATVNLVLLYGWNEYHERTELEPHTDFTASHSSAETTSCLVGAFNSGESLSSDAKPGIVDPSFMLLDFVLLLGLVALSAMVFWTRLRPSFRLLYP